MSDKNLWGAFNVAEKQSPKSILQEQAAFLVETTNQLLKGEVYEKASFEISSDLVQKFAPLTRRAKNIIKCTFYVIAPKMDYYKIALFDVMYSIVELYPLVIKDIINEKEFECNNQDEFTENLARVIQSEAIRRVIENLILQSR